MHYAEVSTTAPASTRRLTSSPSSCCTPASAKARISSEEVLSSDEAEPSFLPDLKLFVENLPFSVDRLSWLSCFWVLVVLRWLRYGVKVCVFLWIKWRLIVGSILVFWVSVDTRKKEKKRESGFNHVGCTLLRKPRRPMSLSTTVALVMKSGKYTLGYKTVIDTLRSSKGKLIIISNNCPPLKKSEIEY